MTKKILIIGGHIKKNGAKITAPWDKNLVITEGSQNIEGADELFDSLVAKFQTFIFQNKIAIMKCPHDLDVSGEIDWVNKNSDKGSIIISIHHNAELTGKASGTEAFFYAGNKEGEDLAIKICRKISKKTGLPNRGAKIESKTQYDSIGIISKTKGTAVLVECGFLTNPKDRDIILNPQKDNLFSEAIAEALAEYLGISMQPAPETMQKSYSDYLDEAIEHEEKALELMKKIRDVIIK